MFVQNFIALSAAVHDWGKTAENNTAAGSNKNIAKVNGKRLQTFITTMSLIVINALSTHQTGIQISYGLHTSSVSAVVWLL